MYKLLVVTPKKDVLTQTFIKAHFDGLKKFKIDHIYGWLFPYSSTNTSYRLRHYWKLSKIAAKLGLKRLVKQWYFQPILRSFLKKQKYSCILAEFGPVGAEITPVCKSIKIPLVVHFHGYDAYVDQYLQDYKYEYQEMFSYATYLVAVSTDMRDQLIKLGAPASKVVYNVYGPREVFFSIQSTFANRIALSVGRFVAKKSPLNVIRAFKPIASEFPDARLIMIGDGPLLRECQLFVEEKDLTNQIIFKGALDTQSIIDLMHKSYCYVQHSVTAPNGDREGTPLAILEAGAASLPVIATKHAGIKDVVINSRTGYLVEENDIEKMTGFIRELFLNRNSAIKMGKENKKNIMKNFRLNNHLNKLSDLLEKSIKMEENFVQRS